MAISNCLFSPTVEIPQEFQLGGYLRSFVLNYATTHSLDVVSNVKFRAINNPF